MTVANHNSGDPSRQADDLFFAALEIESDSERRTYLDSACAGDPALRREVDRLLGWQAEADQLDDITSPSGVTAADIADTITSIPEYFENMRSSLPDDSEVGKQVGNYTLLQKIGEGGVGVVYLAQQIKPVRRQVALKIIKAGMDTKSVIARFEAERQALAIMEHPNIAHVLNAGETETGRPYFVMDLVHGQKITSYCNENKLGVRKRLDLFMEVCNAILHAHQKGIIHRDIKPSNVLITDHDGVPSPVVIDFGIAKATTEELLTDKTLNTGLGPLIGTPAYMSPEQANRAQLDIDTRSDIYSLGVLLYELLVGTPPITQKELLKCGVVDMCQTLFEYEPLRPSVKLRKMPPERQEHVATRRGMDPKKLSSILSGDLDWIVMKALEKDRERRYESASELAMDVGHFLYYEPVKARPPSRRYRIGKLIRRNRSACASIVAVAIALLIGFGTSTWLFIREREALREAKRARQSEVALRAEADARAKIARAALLIDRDQLLEASELLKIIEIPVTEPSLEAAKVFRTLAFWHVSRGNWSEAVTCFLNLQRANQLDETNTTEEMTRDLLGAGPALLMAGETELYHQFVQETLDRFTGTTDPKAAEQLLKNSLLLPPSDSTLERLKPFAELVEKDMRIHKHNSYHLGWRILALSLYEYRCGNDAEAIHLGQNALNLTDHNPPRVAMNHIVIAMASGLDRTKSGNEELQQARFLIETRFPDGVGKISNLGSINTGMWHDWVIGYLFLQQAEEQMTNTSSPK